MTLSSPAPPALTVCLLQSVDEVDRAEWRRHSMRGVDEGAGREVEEEEERLDRGDSH